MRSETRLPALTFVASACAAAALATAAGRAVAAGNGGGRNLPSPLPPSLRTHAVTSTEHVGSFNWSGYAQTAPVGTFHAVVDNWTVPTVNTAFAGNQFSSDWVGIGGFEDGTLVQAGTEADNLGGAAFYRAWTEILPEPENPLPMAIHPGDKITTTVREIKLGVWKMTVSDKTTKRTESRTQSYAGSTHASVESIHERPCIKAPCTSTADLAELTHTTNVTFDPGKYALALGVAPNTALLSLAPNARLFEISMLNNAGTAAIASPSVEDKDLDGFAVADGAVSPPAPKS
jgi:Peptidase A4 family